MSVERLEFQGSARETEALLLVLELQRHDPGALMHEHDLCHPPGRVLFRVNLGRDVDKTAHGVLLREGRLDGSLRDERVAHLQLADLDLEIELALQVTAGAEQQAGEWQEGMRGE